MKQIHKVQLEILKKLLFVKKLRFTDLKPDKEMENNQFDYHLDQLIDQGLIYKNDQNYKLSDTGKEYASRIETENNKIVKQAKISAWLACIRTINGNIEYLICTRKKHPFYGCQGFCGGKVQYGELFMEAASRELWEETGLQGTPKLALIKHYRVFNKEDVILEDKLMLFFRVDNPEGTLKPDLNEGEYNWILESELDSKVINYYEDKVAFDHQIEIIRNYNGQVVFEETDRYADNF